MALSLKNPQQVRIIRLFCRAFGEFYNLHIDAAKHEKENKTDKDVKSKWRYIAGTASQVILNRQESRFGNKRHQGAKKSRVERKNIPDYFRNKFFKRDIEIFGFLTAIGAEVPG